MKAKILVVGIGNPIRRDDGIGPYCISLLQADVSQRNKLVDYLVVHQLDVTQCEIFAGYGLILFIDADAVTSTEPFRVEQITAGSMPRAFTSHIGSIPDIMSLTASLYGVTPRAWLVAVQGVDFEVGEGLSPAASDNAGLAAAEVSRLIEKFFPLG